MRILITGGTSGIGQQLAMKLSAGGHYIDVIGGTNQVKGMNLVALSQGRINYYPADLGNIGDVKRVAAEYLAEHNSLDCLVLNAGVYQREPVVDDLGVDKAFVVNYLHRFMLLLLLRPLLLNAEDARVLINGSLNVGGLDLDEQVFGRQYSGMKGMNEAFKANALMAYWLNHQCAYGIDIDAINPGFVNTKMARKGNWLMRLMRDWFAISPAQAADKMHQLLLTSRLSFGGSYFNGLRDIGYRRSVTKQQHDFENLWQQSLRLANMQQPYWAGLPSVENSAGQKKLVIG
ncbi:SDR family NAD(P)-dependent oxidoreductase [Aliamphritea ceti]|uniref:SDR family NAD(P)-dependent oxidoreductase n=1 Tax=Aliamphritea ceti TaxID=1524258 RepID=UPI0021C25910|nr:SDR family NAD(P)-dependent oxidoreductase [Aliamphritea ceti]